MKATRAGISAAPADEISKETGIDKGLLLHQLDTLIAALDELTLAGVKMGPELLDAHKKIRESYTALPREEFARSFNLDASDAEAYTTGRFEILKSLEDFHRNIEAQVAIRRTGIVRELAADIGNPAAREKLEALRPLSLTGLQRARESAEGETLAAIDAEIAAILEGATTVQPGMRIFYDKRTGAPRMNEPVKDPHYHRTLARDTYFILQDARPDGTATFRYFIKPQMSLGLGGLVIIVIGTVLAFLPQFRRKRPEVA
jgi:hypothetical protein